MTQENSLGLHDLLAGSVHCSHLLRKLMVSVTKDTSWQKAKARRVHFGLEFLGDTVHSGWPAWWECRKLADHIVSSLRKPREKRKEEPGPKASPTTYLWRYSSSREVPQPFPNGTTS